MKKLIALFLMLLFIACGADNNKENGKKDVKKIGIVLSPGGLGDKSFNDSAYKGLEKAKKDFGIEFKYVEPTDISEVDVFLRDFSEANFDLIIGIGFRMKDSLEQIAKEYPENRYLMVDEPIELDNVKAITFNEEEGSFLAGALAGLMTKTNSVGFIGGLDLPLIRRFGTGFFKGAKYVNPEMKTLEAYVGGNNPFNDPAKGKEIALSMTGNGADIIYHAAAGSGSGLFELLKETNGIYGIGVDANQDMEVKGKILTSMLKNVDVAVYNTIQDLVNNNFKTGIFKMGVANNGVGLTNFEFTKDVIGTEKLEKLNEIKMNLIDGKIKL